MKTKLKDIAEVSSGKLLTRISGKYHGPTVKREVLTYKLDEIFTEQQDVAEDLDDKSLTENGDIIFKLAEPQIVILINEDSKIKKGAIITSKFALIRVKNSNVNKEYLTYLLNSKLIEKQLNRFNEGIIKQVKTSDLNDLELIIPDINAQREIVDYLNLLDEEIKLQEMLINENKNLKEGIIEQYSKEYMED